METFTNLRRAANVATFILVLNDNKIASRKGEYNPNPRMVDTLYNTGILSSNTLPNDGLYS